MLRPRQPRTIPFSSMGSPPAWRIEPASAWVMAVAAPAPSPARARHSSPTRCRPLLVSLGGTDAAACGATMSSRRDQAAMPVRRTTASSRSAAGIGDGLSCSCTRPQLPRPAVELQPRQGAAGGPPSGRRAASPTWREVVGRRNFEI
jgi:hypothetical protein